MTKLADSIFGTDDFKELSNLSKADFILENEEALSELTLTALEYMGTILLRAMCNCPLVALEDIEDDATEKIVNTRHRKDCPRIRIPTEQDYSDSTLRRRQTRELITSPQTMLIIEESSHRVKCKQTNITAE